MSDLLDDVRIEEIYRRDIIQNIGLGIFLWLAIMGFSYLLNNLIKGSFILMNFSPILNFWITEVIICLSVLFSFIISFNKIKKKEKGNKLFRNIVILFGLSQILQFFYSYYIVSILPNYYLDNLINYNKAISENYIYILINTSFEYVKYVIVLLLIGKNRSVSS